MTPVVIAVVQARLSSHRLPGKVLRPLRGRPLLAHLLEGLTHCRSIDGILVATSTDPSDDAIDDFVRSIGVACHRGPLDDVAVRLLTAASSAGADALVRLSGDSPLLDPALVDRAVELFRAEPADLVSNVVIRTFPKGQSVEVLARPALAIAVGAMTTAYEREHVTPFFYARAGAFRIRSFEASQPRPLLQLSVDDAVDLARCEVVMEQLGRPPWEAGWEACARVSEAVIGLRS